MLGDFLVLRSSLFPPFLTPGVALDFGSLDTCFSPQSVRCFFGTGALVTGVDVEVVVGFEVDVEVVVD
jgi:hypothetical protein